MMIMCESSIDDQPDPGSISGESSLLLPIVGPYDLGTSLLKGRFSDDDKYKVLKHLDQPQQCYEFPAVKEGKQLRRFQSSWFSSILGWHTVNLKMVDTVHIV